MEKSAVYNVRVSLRDIATLHQHFSAKGNSIDSVSGLTRQCVEFLSTQVVSQLGAVPFHTIADARNYLEAQGLLKPLRHKAIVRGLQEESLSLEGLGESYMDRKGIKSLDKDQVKAARDIFQQRTKSAGGILGPNPGEVVKP